MDAVRLDVVLRQVPPGGQINCFSKLVIDVDSIIDRPWLVISTGQSQIIADLSTDLHVALHVILAKLTH